MKPCSLSLLLVAGLLSSCVSDLVPPPAPPVTWLDLAVEPLKASVPLRTDVGALRVEWEPAEALLSDRLMVRRGPHEVAFDDGARWLRSPVDVLERALEDELHGRRGLPSSMAPGTLRVTCTLERFELDLQGAPAARVGLRAEVHRGEARGVLLSAGADRAVPAGASTQDAVAALSEALVDSLLELAEQLEAQLVSGS